MSNRLWGGFCLAPWLLASGCTTVPFANNSPPQQLPTERKLAIAQTFERQGRSGQAREIYEQILADEPNSPVASQRLDSLMARLENSPPSKPRSSQQMASGTRAPQHPRSGIEPHPAIADVSKSTPSGQAQAEPGETGSRITELHSVSHVELNRTEDPAEPSKTTTAAVEIPPSPTHPAVERNVDQQSSAVVSKPIAAKDDVEWELPVRTPIQFRQTRDLAASRIQNDLEDSGTEPVEPAAPQTKPGLDHELPDGIQHLFGKFTPAMLDEVRAYRIELQDQLLAVAVDSEMESQHRTRALFLLGQIGSEAVNAVPALKPMMNEVPDKSLRIETAEAILMIQPDDEHALRLLLDLLKSDDVNARWYAAFVLRLGAHAHPTYANLVVNRLLESMDEGDVRLKRMAMLSLGAFGPGAEKAIPKIEAALEDPDHMTRVIASTTLKLIKTPAQPLEVASSQTDDPATSNE
jgi:hypothetical protein